MNMRSIYEPPEPPSGLTEKVLARIARRERHILVAKIVFMAAGFAASAGIAVASGMDVAAEMAHSGFFAIGGLAFSDLSAVLANFTDFGLSLIESLPLFAAAALLGGAMFAVWSFAALVDEASHLKNDHEQSFGV